MIDSLYSYLIQNLDFYVSTGYDTTASFCAFICFLAVSIIVFLPFALIIKLIRGLS